MNDFELRVNSRIRHIVQHSTVMWLCVCALKLLFVQIPVTKNPVAICCHCSHRTCHRAICGPCPFGLMVGLLLKRWSSLNCSRVALVCYRLMGKCVFKQEIWTDRLQQMLTWFSRKDGQDLTYSIYISKSYCKSSPPLHASQCVPRMGGASHRCHQGCVEVPPQCRTPLRKQGVNKRPYLKGSWWFFKSLNEALFLRGAGMGGYS